jgi:hypothetical protein
MERCERLRLFRIWQGGARKGRCGRQDLFGSGSARLGNTDQVGQAGRGLARCVRVGQCSVGHVRVQVRPGRRGA